MKRIHSSWFHFAAQGSVAVAIVFPVVGIPLLAGSVILYKKTKNQEDIERATENRKKRDRYVNEFRARQNYDTYEHYLQSTVWRAKRGAVLRRAYGYCEAPECTATATEVHHKRYPEVWGREELEDLIALCRVHHEAEHGIR